MEIMRCVLYNQDDYTLQSWSINFFIHRLYGIGVEGVAYMLALNCPSTCSTILYLAGYYMLLSGVMLCYVTVDSDIVELRTQIIHLDGNKGIAFLDFSTVSFSLCLIQDFSV
jgi:hypothetical protein